MHWWEESLPAALSRVAELKRACDALERRVIELSRWKEAATENYYDAIGDRNNYVKKLNDAESALAQQSDDLLVYKDYYGTSVAQVRHLSTCVGGCCPRDCSGDDDSHDRCNDYPME